MVKTINVWARLGTSINVDENEFKKSPEKAIIKAIRQGNYEFGGDSYVPFGCVDGDEESEELGFEL